MINQNAKTARATIAWLAPGGAPPDAAIRAAANNARLAFGARPRPVDVAVVDLRKASEPESLIAEARRLAAPAGFLILASPGCDAPTRARFRRSGETIFAGAEPVPLIAAIVERLRLAALAEETSDRIKTLIAAGLPVSFPKLDHAARPLAIIVAGRPSPLTLRAVSAVKPHASETACVFSAGQAMRALDHQRFDGAIFLPADENDLLIPLARALRRHRNHRRLPVVMTTPDDDFALRLRRRDGFDTISTAHIDEDLFPHLEQAAQRTNIAAAMREFLKSADAGADPRTGALGVKFFAQHAARMFRRADSTARPVTLLGVWRDPDLPVSLQRSDDEQMRNVARIARQLVRAEDLVGKLSPTMLAVALWGTTGDLGVRAAERLQGVIAGSLGRATRTRCIRTLAIERETDTSLETCLARLIRLRRDSANPWTAAI